VLLVCVVLPLRGALLVLVVLLLRFVNVWPAHLRLRLRLRLRPLR